MEQQRKSTQKEEEGHKGVAVPVPPDQIEETLKKHETRTSKKPPTTQIGTTTKDGISTWVYLSGSESTTVKSKKKTTTPSMEVTTPLSITSTTTAATTAVTETESRVNQKNSTQVEKKKNKRRRRPVGVKPTTDVTEKPKQPQKPLSTQIYNYLAREVMPSVGVGLLGLVVTAGLAGLFMYPFGGGIARRTYEVDPHEAAVHYANPEDKHGHREEEVFGQVLAGMSNNPAYAYNEAQTGTQYKVAADQQTDGYHGYYPAREKYRHYTSTTFRYPSTTTKYPNVDEISITEATEPPPPARHRYPDTYPTRRYSEPHYQTAESGQEAGQHTIETTTKDSYLPENYEIRRYSNEMRSFMNPRDLKISREKRSVENNENELDSDLDKISTTTSRMTTSISPMTINDITTITTEDTPTTTETPITTTTISELENEFSTNPSSSSTSSFSSNSSSNSSSSGSNSSSSNTSTTISTTTVKSPFLTTFKNKDKDKLQYQNDPEPFSLLSLFRRVAAFKLRLGLDMLKSSSRAFYRYLDDVERRIDRRSDQNKQ